MSLYAELASFLQSGDDMDSKERTAKLKFFEDLLRFQEERLRILRRYHTGKHALAAPDRAFGLAAKLDALFSFDNLAWVYDDVEELADASATSRTASSRQPSSSSAATSCTTPSSATQPPTTTATCTSSGSDQRPLNLGKAQRRRRRTAKKSVQRFDQLLQELKNTRREERTRALLRHDAHYRGLQTRVAGRLDTSLQRTRVWSLRTCCAFAIFDHALDERSEYSGVLPNELHDYVNVVAFFRRFLRARWLASTVRMAPRRPVLGGSDAGGGAAAGAAAAAVAGLAALLGDAADGGGDGGAERDMADDDETDEEEERRVIDMVSSFELVPEGITFTVRHTPPRGSVVEEIAITCFGEDFIECSPGHARGVPLFSCSARHVAGLAQDKFSSKYMNILYRSLQTPPGVRDTDLLYIILSIHEAGSDYPSLMSGLVQTLKQKLASFNTPVV